MNRSILLVICDFLILSVLSLSSGVGTHKSPIPLYEKQSNSTVPLEFSNEFSQTVIGALETQWAEQLNEFEQEWLASELQKKEEVILQATELITEQEKMLQKASNESVKYQQQTEQLDSDLEVAQQENQILATKLTKALEPKENVLVRYDEAVRELNVYMREKDVIDDDDFQATLFLPEVVLNDKPYLVAEFESIGLRWKQLKDGDIDLLSFTVAKSGPTPSSQYVDGVYAVNQEPRVCLIPSSLQEAQQGLIPIGFDQLMYRGVDNIFLYTKDGRRSLVEVYPDMRNKGYLIIKNVFIDQFSNKYNAAPGDFLLTKEGEFVGIVVQEQQGEALCYVLPIAIPENEMIALSLRKEGSEQF